MTTLCENLGEGKFRECSQLYQWTTSVPLPRPYLKQPAFWAPNKFQGFCKFSIAPSNELLAVASPGGDLLIFARKDEEVALKYQLTITPDDHPEYTLLEWSASESLVLASRTDATVIVVEATGSFCYEVPMYDELRNARRLITQIRSTSSDDPDFVDLLYVLQIDGCLTGVKLGKYSDFAIAFSVHLGPSPSAALLVIPKFNIFVASSEYNDSYTPTKGDDGTELGLSAYRFVEDYPFTQCIKQTFIQARIRNK